MNRIILSIFFICIVYAGNAITVNPNAKFIVLPGTEVGMVSNARKITLQIYAHVQDLKIYVSGGMQLSLDSNIYSTSLIISPSSITSNVNIYIRNAPTISNKVFKEQVVFVHNNLDTSFNRIYILSSSMPSDSFYTMLTWNTRWLGDPGSCNCDTAAQIRNIQTILKEVQPDITALQEVVYVNRVAELASEMGSNFSSNFSTFCSFALSVSDADYAGGQKLAYIYNNNLFESVKTYGMFLSTTSTVGTGNTSPYYYFSSGRFPFVMMLKNKQTNDTVTAINIHAKASGGNSDYLRRQAGAVLIADSLNTYYQNRNMVLLGDYNDFLEGTTATSQSISPYQYLLNTSLTGISLPSLYPNATTYPSISNSLIDNYAMSNKLFPAYVPGSFTILDPLSKAFWDYTDSVSDHYPAMVYIKKNFTNTATNEATLPSENKFHKIIIHVEQNIIYGQLPLDLQQVDFYLYDLMGNIICQKQKAGSLRIDGTDYAKGLYILRVDSKFGTQTIKLSL
jgi:trimeric autotransporter adhesin